MSLLDPAKTSSHSVSRNHPDTVVISSIRSKNAPGNINGRTVKISAQQVLGGQKPRPSQRSTFGTTPRFQSIFTTAGGLSGITLNGRITSPAHQRAPTNAAVARDELANKSKYDNSIEHSALCPEQTVLKGVNVEPEVSVQAGLAEGVIYNCPETPAPEAHKVKVVKMYETDFLDEDRDYFYDSLDEGSDYYYDSLDEDCIDYKRSSKTAEVPEEQDKKMELQILKEHLRMVKKVEHFITDIIKRPNVQCNQGERMLQGSEAYQLYRVLRQWQKLESWGNLESLRSELKILFEQTRLKKTGDFSLCKIPLYKLMKLFPVTESGEFRYVNVNGLTQKKHFSTFEGYVSKGLRAVIKCTRGLHNHKSAV